MKLDELTDEELMLRVQADDSAAYQVLFNRHQRRVYGFLLRKTGRREEAAELFQETWLKVHRARATYQAEQRFSPWLYSIAANTRRDAGRRQTRRIETVHVEQERAAPTPHHAERMTLEQAIAKLPEILREAFLLGAVEGHDHNDIAEALDISPANARRRISRARQALREALGVDG